MTTLDPCRTGVDKNGRNPPDFRAGTAGDPHHRRRPRDAAAPRPAWQNPLSLSRPATALVEPGTAQHGRHFGSRACPQPARGLAVPRRQPGRAWCPTRTSSRARHVSPGWCALRNRECLAAMRCAALCVGNRALPPQVWRMFVARPRTHCLRPRASPSARWLVPDRSEPKPKIRAATRARADRRGHGREERRNARSPPIARLRACAQAHAVPMATPRTHPETKKKRGHF